MKTSCELVQNCINLLRENYININKNKKIKCIKKLEELYQQCQKNNINSERTIKMIDDILLLLEDNHVKVIDISIPKYFYDLKIVWKNYSLFYIENKEKEYLIKTINEIDQNQIMVKYKKKYGFKTELFIKEKIISDLLFSPVNESDKLIIGFEKNKKVETVVLFAKKMDLKCITSQSQMVSSLKFNYANNTLYLNICSFADVRLNSNLNNIAQKNIKNIILDLRNNTGGLINLAKDFTSLFLYQNIKLDYFVCSNDNKKTIIEIPSKQLFKFEKIYILINNSTMSCAEYIVTYALKTLYKENCLIIGQNSAKVAGQARIFKLDEIYYLQLTTKIYINTLGEIVEPKKVDVHLSPNNEIDDLYKLWIMRNLNFLLT